MSGLWRNNPKTPEGKYLVKRRDGTIPMWPWFVLGGNDRASVAALRAYANEAERIGLAADYVGDVREMAKDWEDRQIAYGTIGDPDAGPDQDMIDDQATIAEMRNGHSA